MRFKTSGVLALLAMLFAAGSAWAHHSPSSIFDMSQKFVLTGTLTQVEWVNPHIAVYIYAKKSDGRVENWRESQRLRESCGPNGDGGRESRAGWLALWLPFEDHVRGWQLVSDGFRASTATGRRGRSSPALMTDRSPTR